jgi:hypothetical protein
MTDTTTALGQILPQGKEAPDEELSAVATQIRTALQVSEEDPA